MTTEFSIIAQYFKRSTQHTDLGVGDDAALIQVAAGQQLVVSADMSVEGTHFFPDAKPYDIGWKSLAVNISDMAAMGAKPKWMTLSLALPEVDHAWLSDFAAGLFDCAQQFGVDLIGGDTTRGPRNISIQIMGEVPVGKALTRAGAKVNDDIWVSGVLGNAAIGLDALRGYFSLAEDEKAVCLKALHHPTPRVILGLALQDVATSCIDVSDGFLADLAHITEASKVGAHVFLESLPYLKTKTTMQFLEKTREFALSGGEDYELCFTASPHARAHVEMMALELNVPLTRVGVMTSQTGISLIHHGQPVAIQKRGFDHFE